MTKHRIITALASIALAALALTGCSLLTPPAPADPGEVPTNPVRPLPDSITPPGAEIPLGEWASYQFTGTKGEEVVIAARLVSVEKLPAAEDEFLRDNIDGLDGYDIYVMRVEQKKVSGDDVTFNADYTGFKPARADGTRGKELTVIGWSGCKVSSFTAAFEDGEVLPQCFLGLVDSGAAPVAGVIYTLFDTPYDSYAGAPIFFRA